MHCILHFWPTHSMHPWPQLYGFLLVDESTESMHGGGFSWRYGGTPPGPTLASWVGAITGTSRAGAAGTTDTVSNGAAPTAAQGQRTQGGRGHVVKAAIAMSALAPPDSTDTLGQFDRLNDHVLRLLLEGLNALVTEASDLHIESEACLGSNPHQFSKYPIKEKQALRVCSEGH